MEKSSHRESHRVSSLASMLCLCTESIPLGFSGRVPVFNVLCPCRYIHLARLNLLILGWDTIVTVYLIQIAVPKQLCIKDIPNLPKIYPGSLHVPEQTPYVALLTHINSCGSEHEGNSSKCFTSAPNGLVTARLKTALRRHGLAGPCCLLAPTFLQRLSSATLAAASPPSPPDDAWLHVR